MRPSSTTFTHSPAQCSLIVIHQRNQKRQVHHRRHVLFRIEQSHTEHVTGVRESDDAVVNIKHDLFSGGSVMIWAGLFQEGCADLGASTISKYRWRSSLML